MHAELLSWTVSLMSLVLTAQAIYLLQRVQANGQTQPMPTTAVGN